MLWRSPVLGAVAQSASLLSPVLSLHLILTACAGGGFS